MEELQISLDQHRGAYLPGQTISGHVHALFNETIKARQVRVDIIGIARTSWTKWETYYTGKGSSVRPVDYRKQIDYIKTRLILWGGEQLEKGEHKFEFSFDLPDKLPPSLESRHGYIRYTVKAEIDRPRQRDCSVEQAFTVIPTFDLRQIKNIAYPISTKTSCDANSCCRGGRIEISVSINKGGFVPGEDMAIGFEITNRSRRKVIGAELSIVQNCILLGDRDVNIFTLKLCGNWEIGRKLDDIVVLRCPVKCDLAPGQSDTFKRLFRVPGMTPSFSQICPIIECSHTINVRVTLKGTFSDDTRSLQVPILIGTIGTSAKNVSKVSSETDDV